MQVMAEETFGPVLGIMKVSSAEEAIHLLMTANMDLPHRSES